MPLPQTFDRAVLMVNGRQYQLTQIAVMDHEVTMERDRVVGGGGRTLGFTRGTTTERITLSAEVGDLDAINTRLTNGDITAAGPIGPTGPAGTGAGIDSRDASIRSAYGSALVVPPSQAGVSMPETFSGVAGYVSPLPATGDALDRMAETLGLFRQAVEEGSIELEPDESLRTRASARVSDPRNLATLNEASGSFLDAYVAQFGLSRRQVKKEPALKRQLDALRTPTKTALDWILEDETEGDVAA